MTTRVHDVLFTFDPTHEKITDPDADGAITGDPLLRQWLSAMQMDSFKDRLFDIEYIQVLTAWEREEARTNLIKFYEDLALTQQAKKRRGDFLGDD